MLSLGFNKKYTKSFIRSLGHGEFMSVERLDWLLENKRCAIGSSDDRIFRKQHFFLVRKVQDQYRLICVTPKDFKIYYITEIEEFLKFADLRIVELQKSAQVDDLMESLDAYPCSGLMIIDEDDKAYLFDIVTIVK